MRKEYFCIGVAILVAIVVGAFIAAYMVSERNRNIAVEELRAGTSIVEQRVMRPRQTAASLSTPARGAALPADPCPAPTIRATLYGVARGSNQKTAFHTVYAENAFRSTVCPGSMPLTLPGNKVYDAPCTAIRFAGCAPAQVWFGILAHR